MPSAGVSKQLDRKEVEQLVREMLRQRPPNVRDGTGAGGSGSLVVNVSARHVHVSKQHLEILFGPGAKLTRFKDLYQQNKFAADQTVTLVGARQQIIPNVRIHGPTRDHTQVELSFADGVFIGLDLPVRISGDHQGTPGITILGPAGAVTISGGVIRPQRHVHMNPSDLGRYGVKDGDEMKLEIEGPCGLTFDRVKVRFCSEAKLEVQIDTDEANACALESATKMELVR